MSISRILFRRLMLDFSSKKIAHLFQRVHLHRVEKVFGIDPVVLILKK